MKKFQNWLYWKGTRWIIAFYLFLVPVIIMFVSKEFSLLLATLLIPYFAWMKNYEKRANEK